jgi:hypothetical protein
LWRKWHNHYHSCPRKITHRENETKDPDPVMRKVFASNVFHNSIDPEKSMRMLIFVNGKEKKPLFY